MFPPLRLRVCEGAKAIGLELPNKAVLYSMLGTVHKYNCPPYIGGADRNTPNWYQKCKVRGEIPSGETPDGAGELRLDKELVFFIINCRLTQGGLCICRVIIYDLSAD
ncbi:hypothetical protein TRIP_C10040 [Candidatus Zixiibacteriota bacterium]|nr:hypothetical protein TRIP_C10040 [candidate division Zixibacteria bacterium]